MLTSIRWSIAYIFLIPLIVCAIAVWNAYVRINEFEASHHKIAQSTVSTLANEISGVIENQQRLLSVFASRENNLIRQLAQSPENEDLYAELGQKIAEYFPEYFAFTVTDHAGNPFMVDFEGYVGDFCLNDIKEHAEGKPHTIRVHPNTFHYHIDFMVPWGSKRSSKKNTSNKNDGGIFFVSFKPAFIAKLLKLSSPARHELQLINKEISNLIEITEIGSRRKLEREDYRLTVSEQKRALYTTPVKNSHWELTDFRDETLFSDYRNSIIQFSLIIIIVFVIGSIVMIMLLLRSERGRILAEQRKEEMFSLFNHDLRSPLVMIHGFLQMSLEPSFVKDKPELFNRLASSAYDNTQVMVGIVNDIMDIQKMDAGEMSFEFEQVELTSLLNKTVEMNFQLGEKNDVKLELDNNIDEVFINADPRRLTQAITNILSNAIKYSPEGEVVKVAITQQKNSVTITIADKGPGIEKDFQEQVFNKFAQSKSALTRKVGGTGLGLAIVKHIVEAHHGTVAFETEPEKGTTFKISLPF